MRERWIAAILWTFLCACAVGRAAVTRRADFHVAPAGSDAAAGTLRRPFATPARAVRAVRDLVARGLKRNVLVLFRGGTYYLETPLENFRIGQFIEFDRIAVGQRVLVIYSGNPGGFADNISLDLKPP